MIRAFSLTVLILIGVSALHAQDKILMLNGAVLEGKITKRDDAGVTYEYLKGKKQTKKVGVIEDYRIFSITESGKEAEVVYVQDTLQGNFRTVKEMQHFIYGQQDADAHYKATAFGVGTFLVTAGLILFDAQDPDSAGAFDREPSMLIVLATPFAAVLAASVTPVKINMAHVSDPAYLSEDSYVEGYVRKAKVKKVMASLKGYLAGVIVGGGTYYILRP